MEQLTQKLSNGEMTIQELPMPTLSPGMVLVRNHYSLISAGTESTTVKSARKSLLAKAKERPKDVKMVLDMLRKQGPVQTYRAVMKKLDAYSPLGYSSAGEVIGVGEGVTEFAVGDRVACAGAGYANHAEIVCVPVNLCVKLPADANLKYAAYNTLGAIALQGIRQADLRLGESCAVIGLGLLGELVCLMLKASGVKTFGIDVNPEAVQSAKEIGIDDAWPRSDASIGQSILQQTHGLGVDAVIITAGTSSLDPINFAGEIVRKKGRVVVVGAVPTGFERNPYYYPKELEVRMSCSYGPGRYDLSYEEKGENYPAAYVRWTENRNMQAFQELIHSGRISLERLTTHEFKLDDAPAAYNMILKRTEPYLGVMLKYDVAKPLQQTPVTIQPKNFSTSPKIGFAFIGAGSYAQGNLLPNIHSNADIVPIGIMTNSGTTSKRVAEKFRFGFCTSNANDILDNDDVNTLFIATRHNTHAQYVLDGLKRHKNVFVEKPICLTLDELVEIHGVYSQLAQEPSCPRLMVGFNRRFAPHAVELKKKLGNVPISAIYRINSGSIPKDTWIQDVTIGGGRILGEVCHFIDFLSWLCGSLPKSVYATALPDPDHLNDIVSISLKFENGSIGTVHYFANGSKELPKEYVEVYQAGQTGVLKDFKSLDFYGNGSPKLGKTTSQNKGQAAMMSAFLDSIRLGKECPISADDIFRNTLACFAVQESLASGQEIQIDRCFHSDIA
ncbi:MAG: bi-domain-containing oxidoreductase [Planctomycetia bacterium]|nr:bi-domain-containing oxidoreductase [Planctomycetia bacterium]